MDVKQLFVLTLTNKDKLPLGKFLLQVSGKVTRTRVIDLVVSLTFGWNYSLGMDSILMSVALFGNKSRPLAI